MTTGYDIFIKAPQFSGCEDVVALLTEAGATEAFQMETPFPDHWWFTFPGLYGTEIMNMRSDFEAYRPGDFEYGYDFRVMTQVPYPQDTPETRQLVAMLAASLGRSVEVLLVYNLESTILKNDAAGEQLYRPEGHDASYYLVDWINYPVDVLLRHGNPLHVRRLNPQYGDLTIGYRHDPNDNEITPYSYITELRSFHQPDVRAIEGALRKAYHQGQLNVTLDFCHSGAQPEHLYRALSNRTMFAPYQLPERIQAIYLDSCGWEQIKVLSPLFVDCLSLMADVATRIKEYEGQQ